MPTRIKLSGHWPEWMPKDEAAICNRLITFILRAGYLIQVREFEAGEVMCAPTKDRAEIQRQTAATGGGMYEVVQQLNPNKAVRIASFLLIHGNGEDVISDASWNPQVPELEAFIDAACAYANGGHEE
jgi:hypothetical protein